MVICLLCLHCLTSCLAVDIPENRFQCEIINGGKLKRTISKINSELTLGLAGSEGGGGGWSALPLTAEAQHSCIAPDDNALKKFQKVQFGRLAQIESLLSKRRAIPMQKLLRVFAA